MIVEQIQFDNRTFYAKFERINEPLTPLLLKQHLEGQYIIAVPLLQDNHTNYLVLEYKGKGHQRFHHLVKHLFHTLDIKNYHVYRGKDEEKIQVFIEADNISLQEAELQLQALSLALEQRLAKKWKCLPSSSLPEAYNIVTLPYKAM